MASGADAIENRLVGINHEIYEISRPDPLSSTKNLVACLVIVKQRITSNHFTKYARSFITALGNTFKNNWRLSMTQKMGRCLKLYKATVSSSVASPISRYKLKLATYGAEDTFDQKMAEGFLKLWACHIVNLQGKWKQNSGAVDSTKGRIIPVEEFEFDPLTKNSPIRCHRVAARISLKKKLPLWISGAGKKP